MPNRFNEPVINRNIDVHINIFALYNKELSKLERLIEKNAKQHNPKDYLLLQTVPGIGLLSRGGTLLPGNPKISDLTAKTSEQSQSTGLFGAP
ncbi:hypothetical protein GCE9029_00818 [Grimontia celer]|uniref:Uncharacterized protein n=1 Tax=Grimontia celer TaxID=1796497 RepID=A0A128EV02_9GAMM|nr:hypothetical protein [Grimontia celer]CZF78408.1 hypothetical protein GCE9029_00818 [Grimontia celer]